MKTSTNKQCPRPKVLWGPAWLHARRDDRRPSEALVPGPPKYRASTPEDCFDYFEECWQQVTQHDYDHLNGPRDWPSPCPWCGGRYIHSRACQELTASWEPTMPFGKHKGKRLSGVPKEYLNWLFAKGQLTAELRDAIKPYL